MNCKNAEKLIMNYMDNTLSSSEAEKLNKHLKTCNECKEAFDMYETMLTSFENIEIELAPDNFEETLMVKISAISPAYTTQKGISADGVNSIVWGTFTVVFGTGIMLNMYKEPLMNYIVQNEYIAEFYQSISPIGNLIAQYINDVFNYIESITISMSGLLSYSKIICGILVAILCFVQIWIKKSKVDA